MSDHKALVDVTIYPVSDGKVLEQITALALIAGALNMELKKKLNGSGK